MQNAKSTLSKLRPFTFDDTFENDDVWNQEPVHSDAHLKEEKETSYQEGYKKGFADGESAKIGQCVEILQRVSGKIDQLQADRDKYLEPTLDQISKALQGSINLFLNAAEEELALDSLVNFLKTTLENLRSRSKVLIFVNPEMKEALTERMNAVASELRGLPKHLSFRDDPNMGLADCRLDYEVGGIEKSLDSLKSRINESFESFRGNIKHRAIHVDENEDASPDLAQHATDDKEHLPNQEASTKQADQSQENKIDEDGVKNDV